MEAEAQGPVQCGSSPTDPLVPRAGALEALMFPFPLSEQRPGLSKEEGRAFPAQKGALLSPAWECGGPGRAQEAAEHGAHPEVPLPARCHIYLSRSGGSALAGPWIPSGTRQWWVGAQPWLPWAGRGVALGAAQAVLLGQQWGARSQHKHNISLCLSAFFGWCLGSLSGSSSELKRLLL